MWTHTTSAILTKMDFCQNSIEIILFFVLSVEDYTALVNYLLCILYWKCTQPMLTFDFLTSPLPSWLSKLTQLKLLIGHWLMTFCHQKLTRPLVDFGRLDTTDDVDCALTRASHRGPPLLPLPESKLTTAIKFSTNQPILHLLTWVLIAIDLSIIWDSQIGNSVNQNYL